MQKRSKSKRELEFEAKEIRAATGEPSLYYPGGGGGGGSARKKSGSPVVRPHVKTHSKCKDCGVFHTTEQHEAHSLWKGGAASMPSEAASSKAKPGSKSMKKTKVERGVELVAEAVHRVAPKIKQSERRGKWRGRIGTSVFIDAVWRLLRKEPKFAKKTLAWFKEMLVEANREQLLELTRLDLTDIADQESIRESEISHLGSTFHLITDRDAVKKRYDPYGFSK